MLESRFGATTAITVIGMHASFCPKKLEARGGRRGPAGLGVTPPVTAFFLDGLDPVLMSVEVEAVSVVTVRGPAGLVKAERPGREASRASVPPTSSLDSR